MCETLAVGVDLGGTKIATALVNSQGQVLASRQTTTNAAAGPEAVLSLLADEVRQILAAAPGPVLAIGVGSPGQVIADQGLVRGAVNLGWDQVDLVRGLQTRLEASPPILIQKDTNASTLGEYYFGAGRGCKDLVYLSVGTGLGCGLLTGGKLVTGSNWLPSDLGHLVLDPDGRVCACGQRGCAETIVSGPGMIQLACQWADEGRYPTSLPAGPGLTSHSILSAARSGDRLAVAVLEKAGTWLGQIMAICIAALNPGRVVLGGGLALAAFDLLVEPAWREIHRRVLPNLVHGLEILPSQLTSSAVGPACLAWYAQECEKADDAQPDAALAAFSRRAAAN